DCSTYRQLVDCVHTSIRVSSSLTGLLKPKSAGAISWASDGSLSEITIIDLRPGSSRIPFRMKRSAPIVYDTELPMEHGFDSLPRVGRSTWLLLGDLLTGNRPCNSGSGGLNVTRDLSGVMTLAPTRLHGFHFRSAIALASTRGSEVNCCNAPTSPPVRMIAMRSFGRRFSFRNFGKYVRRFAML